MTLMCLTNHDSKFFSLKTTFELRFSSIRPSGRISHIAFLTMADKENTDLENLSILQKPGIVMGKFCLLKLQSITKTKWDLTNDPFLLKHSMVLILVDPFNKFYCALLKRTCKRLHLLENFLTTNHLIQNLAACFLLERTTADSDDY